MSNSGQLVPSGTPGRRVLVVAYDFPPHGAIGTMRTLRLVRALVDEAWDVTVLTSSPDSYQAGTPLERGLEAQVPVGVRILRAPTIRGLDSLVRAAKALTGRRPASVPTTALRKPRTAAKSGRLRRLSDWVDALCSLPDNESGWMLPAILIAAVHMGRYGRPDMIYSSAPPWSGQVVGLALASLARRPWAADFRDPWARAPWRDWRWPFRQRVAAALERRVVGRADAVLFVTRANLKEYAVTYGDVAARRFHLVPNGCDPSEFQEVPPLVTRPEFVLLHAGTLYGARNPMPIIEAVARAVNRGALDRSRFRLRFLGPISLAVDLPAECRRLGIADVVEFVPRVSRDQSLGELRSASALLLVQVGTTMSVPGKAYEYLAAGRPILSLAEEGETADLVRASGIGRSVTPQAPVDVIESALLEVVALASGPTTAPDPALYDGRVHARATVRLLSDLARCGGKVRSVGGNTPAVFEESGQ